MESRVYGAETESRERSGRGSTASYRRSSRQADGCRPSRESDGGRIAGAQRQTAGVNREDSPRGRCRVARTGSVATPNPDRPQLPDTARRRPSSTRSPLPSTPAMPRCRGCAARSTGRPRAPAARSRRSGTAGSAAGCGRETGDPARSPCRAPGSADPRALRRSAAPWRTAPPPPPGRRGRPGPTAAPSSTTGSPRRSPPGACCGPPGRDSVYPRRARPRRSAWQAGARGRPSGR